MWTEAELNEEQEIQRILDQQDIEDAALAHQQGLDEQAERLTEEEQKELTLWHLEITMRDAIAQCGRDAVNLLFVKVMNDKNTQ